jgi:hypothetical protein
MLGKGLFYVSSFTFAWIGLMLMFKGYAIPGVLIVGFGYTLFKVTCPIEGDGM